METRERTVGFVIFPDFTGLDLVGPHEVLCRAWSKCHIIAAEAGAVRSGGGLVVQADFGFDTAPALDVLVVCGGPGQTPAMQDERLLQFIRERTESAEFVFGVCTGVMLLAQAGVLKGRKSTTHWLATHALKQAGTHVEEQRFVWDGKWLAAAGVSAGIDGALELLRVACGERHAARVQLAMEYDPKPPLSSGHPRCADATLVKELRAKSRFPQRSE